MSTHFFTNRDDNSLLKKFEGVLEHVPNLRHFDALIGYFRSSGYFKLRPYLENIENIRILVGINVDQLAEKYHAVGQQYIKDPKETSDAFLSKLKEEVNETLIFLQELRDFKKNNSKHFDFISKIPKKARLARSIDNVNADYFVNNSSITYVKSEGHPGVFYRTDENDIVHELNFVDAAKIFKTTPKEVALKPLPDFHHAQVNKTTAHFKNVVKTTENKKVIRAQLSAIEKRVLNVLPTYAAQVQDKFYKQVLKRTMDEIYKGSHRKLPTNIDKAFKRYKKEGVNDLEVLIDRLYKDVLKEYKFSDNEQPNGPRAADVKMFAKPQIVISESFAQDE